LYTADEKSNHLSGIPRYYIRLENLGIQHTWAY